jgi:hypothetical protein
LAPTKVLFQDVEILFINFSAGPTSLTGATRTASWLKSLPWCHFNKTLFSHLLLHSYFLSLASVFRII